MTANQSFSNLLVEVGEILSGDVSESREYRFNQEKIELTENLSALVTGTITITRASKDTLVARGDFLAEITAPCHRCLEEARLNLNLQLNQAYELSAPDDEELLPIESNSINLREAFYREMMINLPAKILCREDCRGICPNCGVNLNVAEHKKGCSLVA
jgi:uncharacterized protein